MYEKEWLSFEKSGSVVDYLAYCQSATGKFAEYGKLEGQEESDGSDLYPDRDGAKRCPGGGVR